jgi:hypothetical protein
MSDEFRIEAEWLDNPQQDPVERSTFAQIVICSRNQIATELEDLFARTVRTGVRASAYDLALWFAENWWRLRWEPEARNIDWRLTHTVAAVGGGFAWPNLSFTSDGVHVLLESRKTFGGRGAPVRYLRDLDVLIHADVFEAGIDEFIERVLARLSSVSARETELSHLWQELRTERNDDEMYARRRLEALLGFDPDNAPARVISVLQAAMAEAGHGAIEEIAAASKIRAPHIFREILSRTQASDLTIRIASVADILRYFTARAPTDEQPWERAMSAAQLARDTWGIGRGPISNEILSGILDVPKARLEYTQETATPMAAAVRRNGGGNDIGIVLRAKLQTGRRFEIMRLVADHLTAQPDDRLLPATSAKTDRQKFQRAFAQEFLLPFNELFEEVGRPSPGEDSVTEDDIENVAERYDVSPLMVRTTLVNRGVLPHDVLTAAS